MTQHPIAQQAAFAPAATLGALRRRAADHPMGLFAIAATVALLSVTVPLRTADVAVPQQPQVGEREGATERPVQPMTEIDLACSGQVWGSEDADCLVAIAKDGGKDAPARIRTISGA
jgi:hypothetical protein